MAKPTSAPPAPGWHDYPCRDCGTMVRCADTCRAPLCEACRGREIAAYYADRYERQRGTY